MYQPATYIYYGTELEGAEAYAHPTSPKQFDTTHVSRGEFGVGKYFWYDDLPAAILTAVVYEGNQSDWAVLRLKFDNFEESLKRATNATKPAKATRDDIARVIEFDDHGPVLSEHFRKVEVKPPISTTGEKKISLSKIGGHSNSERFREINANPTDYGITANPNEIAWRYNLIIGRCAGAFEDSSLVQMKFANAGLNCLNYPEVQRTVVIKGTRITKSWHTVSNWKLRNRREIYNKYFARYFDGSDVAEKKVDLDKDLGGGGQKFESKGGKRKGK
jgi:hypothetical protein